MDDAEAGVRTGLKDSGLVEGKDYEISMRNASGDMPTILGLIDAALQEGADILVTFSTPTLQAAMNKTSRIPVIFTFVTDPVAAGAGRDYVHHRANVAGVYTHAACEGIIDCVRECIPGVRSIGTLTTPAEANSVFDRDQLVAAAKKHSIAVVDLPLATASDVPDTAAALCSRSIDAVVIVGSNLTTTTFPTIAAAARRARLPVFGSATSQYDSGAVAVVANDFYDAGHGSGKIAARVIRGAKPGDIPFQPTSGTQLLLNRQAAEHCGVKLPETLVRRADKVKE
jgi:ABC-type uncharacterized transport system substrate-binding protein